MRNKFEQQLSKLNDMLIEMGALIETAIGMATRALKEQDVALAEKAIEFDDYVDQKEKQIESLCLTLLLQQQPVASDLRLISAALKMITDMERIGDQAADISEITIMLANTPYIKKLEHIPMMASAAVKMVTESIDAFVKKDLALANAVIDYDDVVDDLFNTVKSELINLMGVDSANGEQAIDLLMIAKYFERIADHAVNIAEWVVFSITGRHVKDPFAREE
ncbi:Phosphate-specific transport system accessory protein PhoU [bioreactor metagenome]|uniref:Phosphate-specific transport system accessory protein PhoU n=1 Tax=bioreactor metagenome TaxID=1076179 RepID=A0A645H369_9ZZZZ